MPFLGAHKLGNRDLKCQAIAARTQNILNAINSLNVWISTNYSRSVSIAYFAIKFLCSAFYGQIQYSRVKFTYTWQRIHNDLICTVNVLPLFSRLNFSAMLSWEKSSASLVHHQWEASESFSRDLQQSRSNFL